MHVILEFEQPIAHLRARINELREMQAQNDVDLHASINHLEDQAHKLEASIFANLSAWQRTQLSRHPSRPYTLDYVRELFTEYTELHGDRAGENDAALICGMARLRGTPVVVIGHQKGRNTKENIHRNFGMARPGGYRKALRVMKLADRFGLPILTFIDTPGAYPGIEAEERGQAEAIARNIIEMSRLKVPIIATVIGEGGSGGALAIGVANRVLMLKNSVYSVISPEGCAAILWRDRAEGPRAAQALKVTADDCLNLEVIDQIVDEPASGAHRKPQEAIAAVGDALHAHLQELLQMSPTQLVNDRYDRFRKIGAMSERSV